MSGYKVQEPEDECPTTYTDFKVEEPNEEPVYYSASGTELNEYWRFYSPLQKKRFNKVLYQLKETWWDVQSKIGFLIREARLSVEQSNEIMKTVHKHFIGEHRLKIQYYSLEAMKRRKDKNYISKRLNKIKSSKTKL